MKVDSGIVKTGAVDWSAIQREEVFVPTPPLPNATATLLEASDLINGERQDSYDHPARDFAATAKIWTGLLQAAGVMPASSEIPARIVPLMMAGLKLRREAFAPKADNRIDACGYAAIAGEVDCEGAPV